MPCRKSDKLRCPTHALRRIDVPITKRSSRRPLAGAAQHRPEPDADLASLDPRSLGLVRWPDREAQPAFTPSLAECVRQAGLRALRNRSVLRARGNARPAPWCRLLPVTREITCAPLRACAYVRLYIHLRCDLPVGSRESSFQSAKAPRRFRRRYRRLRRSKGTHY